MGRWFLEGLGDYMLFVRVLSLHVARASCLERSLGSKYVEKHGCAAPAPVYGFTRQKKNFLDAQEVWEAWEVWGV